MRDVKILQKHESYASERRQYDAIRNGQTDRIQSVFQLTPDGTPGILSRNELRNSKNYVYRRNYAVYQSCY